MNSEKLTSYLIMKNIHTDYIKYLDYDEIDWQDFGWIIRN